MAFPDNHMLHIVDLTICIYLDEKRKKNEIPGQNVSKNTKWLVINAD